ncbi:MAG: hypothetical protein PWP38_1127 [Clostridiales bacterium]|jgi:hypothetical protein|nr:hypothetical protein [Clostridiales bacterium]
MKNEKYLYYYLVLFLLMTLGAFTWQMFMPDLADQYSVWNASRGWQTEIALWNLGVDIGIVITLKKRNFAYAEILTLIAVLLCVLLGGHHLIYALTAVSGNTALHWMGAVEVLFIGGGSGIGALYLSHSFRS